jgi:hypothetical protein
MDDNGAFAPGIKNKFECFGVVHFYIHHQDVVKKPEGKADAGLMIIKIIEPRLCLKMQR